MSDGVILESIYEPYGSVAVETIDFLYGLLAERDETTNISHVSMPDRITHINFVLGRPYQGWWLIINPEGERVGATYLSKNNEVGIFILKGHRGKGYGRQVIRKLKEMFDSLEFPLLANINPLNQASIDLFTKEGFVHIQNTYRWRRPD